MAESLAMRCQPASALARSGQASQEKTTVSSALAATARRMSVTLPAGRSAPQVSTMCCTP